MGRTSELYFEITTGGFTGILLYKNTKTHMRFEWRSERRGARLRSADEV